jgi:predicted ATPase
MIRELAVRNFKCFTNLSLEIAPLTLLTGFNGGGKSTALQPLLLLAQGLRAPRGTRGFPLNGPLIRLGTAGDVLPENSPAKEVQITIKGRNESIEWSLEAPAGERMFNVASAHHMSDASPQLDWRSAPWPSERSDAQATEVGSAIRDLIFLSAVRQGTAEAFPVPDLPSDVLGDVGQDGQFAAYWYDQFVDDEVEPARRHPDEPASSLRKQLDAYLNTLFPGAQANVSASPTMDLLNVRFRLSDSSAWQRPANIGYGLNYSFPILVALLTARLGSIIIVDSPEAHLHPAAQSKMGFILSRFAASGQSIIVETHSDHLVNGVRLAVVEGTLAKDRVSVYFFAGADAEGHGVTRPRLDDQGRFSVWPKGFFDQSEEDLSRLAGWT